MNPWHSVTQLPFDAEAVIHLGPFRMSNSQIAVLALALIGLAIFIVTNHRRRRRLGDHSVTTHRRTDLRSMTQGRRDVEEIMAELDRVARGIHGRLDARFTKLETVIREADQRIDRLARLVRAAEGAPALDITLGEQTPDPDPSAPPQTIESHAAVHRLADSGLSLSQIAAEIGKPAGEVQLILALRRARHEVERAEQHINR